jgi:hypothetical protein
VFTVMLLCLSMDLQVVFAVCRRLGGILQRG